MRRIVFIATLLILCSTTGPAVSAQQTQIAHSGSVTAAMDSSGVSITIEPDGMTNLSGASTMNITVESLLSDNTMSCSLDRSTDSGDITVLANGNIEVSWGGDEADRVVIEVPSIRIAGILASFTCEPAA